MRPPASAVIFDIDDTLVDYAAANTRGLAAHLADVAPRLVGRPDVDACWNECGDRYFDRYLAGDLTFPEQRRRRVRRFCSTVGITLGATDDDADRWMAGFLGHCEAALRPFADVGPALDALAAQGRRLAALSNSTHGYQDRKLTLAGLRHRFAALVCCDDAGGAAKPSPEIFLVACDRLGVRPRDAVYVGDRLATDALAARAAGLTGVWLDRGRSAAADPGVPVLHTLHDLPDLVRTLIPNPLEVALP